MTNITSNSDAQSFSTQVAKKYVSVRRADNPHVISSIFSIASENICYCMSGTQTQHEFAEIFHPYLYPDYIVYQYINKTGAVTRRVEFAFAKSEFTDEEWSTISAAVNNRRAFINGVFRSKPSVIELSYGSLH
jgi:hypothetical protein